MKKLITSITSLTCCALSTIAFSNNHLCVALLNYSATPVKFSPAVDPGYEPVVQPNENKTLSGDFMVGCSKDCDIFISPLDGSHYTEIKHVPKGSQIVYKGLEQYYLDVNANIQCP
jgi:hypothetical protein